MASDINPIHRQSAYAGNVPANDAVSFNTRGGNGRGGGRGKQEEDAEEEAPEESEPAPPQLSSDAFLGTRASATMANLFDDQLPWEAPAGKTTKAPTPPGRGRAATGHLGEPRRVPLDHIKIPEALGSRTPKAARPVLPNAKARRVDAHFDAAGAVNQTWRAQQELIESRNQRASEAAQPKSESGEMGKLLRPISSTGGLRTPVPPQKPLTSKLQPSPSPSPDEPLAPLSSPAEASPAPLAPRPHPPQRLAAGSSPLSHSPSTATRGDESDRLTSPVEILPVAEVWQPEASASETKEPSQDEIVPMAPVSPRGLNGSCLYRVVDIATDLPLVSAQVELEPIRETNLPQFNGKTDEDGWFRQTSVPPGEYRVTVRARGYVPTYKVRAIEPGITDDFAIFMSKP